MIIQKLLAAKIKNAPVTILLTTLICFAAINLVAQEAVQQNQLKFGRLLRLVDSYYVDSVNIDKITVNQS
jgi:carboxyl-terminal processing protease